MALLYNRVAIVRKVSRHIVLRPGAGVVLVLILVREGFICFPTIALAHVEIDVEADERGVHSV